MHRYVSNPNKFQKRRMETNAFSYSNFSGFTTCRCCLFMLLLLLPPATAAPSSLCWYMRAKAEIEKRERKWIYPRKRRSFLFVFFHAAGMSDRRRFAVEDSLARLMCLIEYVESDADDSWANEWDRVTEWGGESQARQMDACTHRTHVVAYLHAKISMIHNRCELTLTHSRWLDHFLANSDEGLRSLMQYMK